MKKILVSNKNSKTGEVTSRYCIIDDEDYERVKSKKWWLEFNNKDVSLR